MFNSSAGRVSITYFYTQHSLQLRDKLSAGRLTYMIKSAGEQVTTFKINLANGTNTIRLFLNEDTADLTHLSVSECTAKLKSKGRPAAALRIKD